MRYKSQNGCLYFYDRTLFRWQLADPTMLFLLGFESATTYDVSVSDMITIANQSYISDSNTYEPFNNFDIYDDIHEYLSQISPVEDMDTYFMSSISGLKLFMNDLTGTSTDRTVPIIFKNDTNDKSIDLSKPMLRISNSTPSLLDLQTQKIIDIFTDAGFVRINDSELSKERESNNSIYKLLDYRSMYSYSLGVLYGCRCIGFDPLLIWRVEPRFWYNGNLMNLVRTAWYVFRFHHTFKVEDLPQEDAEKYKGIAYNRLWNFGDSPSVDKDQLVELHSDEEQAVLFSNDNPMKFVSFDKTNCEYLLIENENPQWQPAPNGVYGMGIGPLDSHRIFYLGNNIVHTFDLYSNAKSDSHNNYITTGNIGFVSNIQHLIEDRSSPGNTPDESLVYMNNLTKVIVHVAKYAVSEAAEDTVYGIDYDSRTLKSQFIIREAKFMAEYTMLPDFIEDYIMTTYYNIDEPVTLYVKDGNTVYDISGGSSIPVPLTDLLNSTGYSSGKASVITCYKQHPTLPQVDQIDVRLFGGKYWYDSTDGWLNSILGRGLFIKSDTSNLYLGSRQIAVDIDVYEDFSSSKFIFNDGSIDILDHLEIGFVAIDELRSTFGITTHICSIIAKDNFGNELVDNSGNYVVWYDADTNEYWNGVNGYNRWVSEKPFITTALMYDASTGDLINVLDDRVTNNISYGSITLSYDDIYNS